MATMATSQQEREDIEGRGWQTLFSQDGNHFLIFLLPISKGLIILMDAMNDFWLRQIRKFTRFFTSFYTPYFILNMRQTKWDEMILRRIDDYEGVKTRYSAVLGVKPARVYIGGESQIVDFHKNALFRTCHAVYFKNCRRLCIS